MAAKFFTGLPLDGPDPECVLGHGELLAGRPRRGSTAPSRTCDHSVPPAAGRGGPPPPPSDPGLR